MRKDAPRHRAHLGLPASLPGRAPLVLVHGSEEGSREPLTGRRPADLPNVESEDTTAGRFDPRHDRYALDAALRSCASDLRNLLDSRSNRGEA